MDGIGTPAELAEWLHRHGMSGAVDNEILAAFRSLRDALRNLLHSVTVDDAPPPSDVIVVNQSSTQATYWPQLVIGEAGYSIRDESDRGGWSAAIAAIAQDAITILGGPLCANVRACHAPGCVLYFVKDHPRREWCSAGCGNRARAARHYRRRRHD